MPKLSNLDLTKAIDSFPYEYEGDVYTKTLDSLYTLIWEDESGNKVPLGYVPPRVVERLVATPEEVRGHVEVDHTVKRLVAFTKPPSMEERNRLIAGLMGYWRAQDAFPLLRGWRNELWPIYSRNDQLLYDMERAATGLFGVTRYGVHLTAYVRCEDASYGIKLWIARRSPSKSTFPSMLDNTAAGGLMTGEDPFDCIVREAEEEADLPEEITRKHTTAQGGVTYTYITEEEAGQAGLIYPEVQWIYDLELPDHVVPRPRDGEVAEFMLCSVDQVKQQLADGEFKPNCALVVIDFFIRWGIITRDNEPDFDEIYRRLHRKLPFPGPHQEDTFLNTISGPR